MQDKEASKAVLNIILSNVENLNLSKRKKITDEPKYSESENFREYMKKLPYVIRNGMVLNRGYNPLWATEKGTISTKKYFKINKSHYGAIYFYNDFFSPWKDENCFNKYMKILLALMSYLDPDVDFNFKSLVHVVDQHHPQGLTKESRLRWAESHLEIKAVSDDSLSDCWSDKDCWITIPEFAKKFDQFSENQIRAFRIKEKKNAGIDRCFVVSKRRIYINHKVFSFYMSGTLPEQIKERHECLRSLIESIKKEPEDFGYERLYG